MAYIDKNKEKQNQKIVIEITENDLELMKGIVYENQTVEWTYRTSEGEDIDIELISQDEMEQRSK